MIDIMPDRMLHNLSLTALRTIGIGDLVAIYYFLNDLNATSINLLPLYIQHQSCF